jgi:putative pyoverdin transport system ATP-binding/permease protein
VSWMSDIVRLLAFLTRWSRSVRGSQLMMLVVVIAGALSGLCNAAFLVIINSALKDPSHRQATMIWSFVGLCLLLPVSRFISGALLLKLAGRAGFELRVQLARKILSAPLRKLEELGAHRLLGTLTQDITAITGAVTSYPNLLMQLFIVVGCLCYLGWLSWPALLGVLGFMVVGILMYQLPVIAANRLLATSREDWDQVVKGIRALTEGTKELKLHQGRRRQFFSGSFEPAADSMQHKGFVGRTILHAASCWGHVLFFVVIGLVLFVLPSYQTVDRTILTGFVLLILYIMTPIESILGAIPDLSAAAVSVRKIDRLGLSLEPELAESKLFELHPVEARWGGLELSGVSHEYRVENAEESFRLGPIDLVLRPGDLLFLTGGNGSGKTTLAKLLCGLYLPESGEIRFGGAAVTAENREAFRQHFSTVFSDFFVFESLRGLSDLDVDVLAAEYLRMLRLDQVVSVQNGSFSRIAVSQGQRKRLALLTAYLEDRPIYLFDEWAADQDVVFKELFYRQLLPGLKARGKTVIVISHDDHYYDVADRVIKLDSGKIESEVVQGPRQPALSRA